MLQNFEDHPKTAANFVALSPISFLKRAALVYGARPALTTGHESRTWAEVSQRSRAFSAALQAMDIGLGDTVAVLLPNSAALFEAHFSVPLAGAVLNTINTRLEAETIAYILVHSDAKLLITDHSFAKLLKTAFDICPKIPVIAVSASGVPLPEFAQYDYETMVSGQAAPDYVLPQDEWQALALNYTSGTSGRPKGVIYHHRGAYLMAMSTIAAWSLPQNPTYLAVVPMFHCNGWNHPWAMAILGGHMIFSPDYAPETLLDLMETKAVTHFGAAPIVLQMIAECDAAKARHFSPPIQVMTAGAPPPPSVLERARALGFQVMQVYGLTETYGHIAQCLWNENWGDLPPAELAKKQAMQGVPFPMVEEIALIDRETKIHAPKDGKTIGEIAIRSNTVMKGYYKDKEATALAFEDGWFWSGDAAVQQDDGYLQIKDRLKDVIISGGENISSVEVEAVLHRHPAVGVASVVARHDAKWGEVPCAFVELRAGQTLTEDALIRFCRDHLAGFKVPKSVIFEPIPKTATGKIQKFQLRERVKQIFTPNV
ncbi:MAG: AMP-binding protein [Proteobacteria bacterium]|jgi:fatty-acyl-CoA synthase|nr:MAG: acyl-CoA synthetase [Rhodobacter sp. BACL10 MAG-120910-bin24]MDA0355076.1 AMP-binding protein [Pseudomonadota bacterium]MDA1043172.1 AMP-binding protein [Pseudomonadota bacterium]|tara:strand:+ start:6566 stop:8191 length:1626 start_codon:yes stop_codon:yes gene_type:complete